MVCASASRSAFFAHSGRPNGSSSSATGSTPDSPARLMPATVTCDAPAPSRALRQRIDHLASDGAPEAHHPRFRHRVGVVDGPDGRGVAEHRAGGVGERQHHRLRALVVAVVVHRDRDGLARLACGEAEPSARRRVVSPAVAVPSDVAFSTVASALVDRLMLTANSSVAPSASSTSASATPSAAGPRTVTESPPASIRPSVVHTPGMPAQSVVARTVSVTSLKPDGSTRKPQPWLVPF